MRPETEGKIIVALIIALIAFGCGSGVGIVIGFSQNDTSSPLSPNYTEQNPQFPTITPSTTEVQSTDYSSQNQNSGSEEVYVENPEQTDNNTNVDNNQSPENTDY